MTRALASSNPSSPLLYDPIRTEWVAATPEERVRQELIRQMVDQLAFPPALLVIEKALAQLPHLQGHQVPSRRADLLAYFPYGGALSPLLLVECKAEKATEKALRQVLGYNTYVGAPFVGVCGSNGFLLGWQEEATTFSTVTHLPSFDELVKALELRG